MAGIRASLARTMAGEQSKIAAVHMECAGQHDGAAKLKAAEPIPGKIGAVRCQFARSEQT